MEWLELSFPKTLNKSGVKLEVSYDDPNRGPTKILMDESTEPLFVMLFDEPREFKVRVFK